MNPKHYKLFQAGIAEKVGVHPDVVEDFVLFYYNKLRKTLVELQHTHVNVTGLGIFYIRKGKLQKAIKKNKDILGNLQKQTYDGFERHIGVKEKLIKFELALDMLNDLNVKKQEFKKNKNESKEINGGNEKFGSNL